MKKFSTVLLLAALVCSLGFVATAEAKKSQRASLEERFAACDKGHKNYLTSDEFAACFPKRADQFAAIDKSGSGKVSLADIKAHGKAKRAAKKQK